MSGDAKTIWFVNRFFYPDHSATSQIVSDLAFHLASRGRTVGVITSRGAYDDPSANLPPFETVKGVAIHRVGWARFGRAQLLGRVIDSISLYAAFAAAAARLARAGDWIVVKTDPPLLSAPLSAASRAKGLRQINWLQDLYPEVALNLGLAALRPVAPLLTILRNASLRTAHCNVAIGDIMAQRLLRSGTPADRVAMIPNWCDDEGVRPLANHQNPLREKWGLCDKFVVGYSGNLGRAHEFQTLLGAAELLRERSDIIFLFIGGGALLSGLKAEVERRGVSACFRFLPYQEASLLPLSLSLPDVHWISLRPEMEGLIVPSKFYGVAAAGRPTIAVSDPRGELGLLVARHECGEAVEPGNSVGLAEAICQFADHPEKCQRQGRNARAALDRNFSRRSCLSAWESFFAEES